MARTARAFVMVVILPAVVYFIGYNYPGILLNKKSRPNYISAYRAFTKETETEELEYSKDIVNQPNTRADSGHTEENETVVFKYSSDIVFETVLGIKNRNCRTLHESKTAEENHSFCDRLQRCNMAKVSDTQLPNGCARRFPGCIIIGVYKAGTRELIDFLAMHPNIVIKRDPKYEISFFSTRWHKGFDWYKKEMPFSMRGQITIEKSPNYFTYAGAPERIKTLNPNIKMILIVRDPVKRAISQMTFRYPDQFVGKFEAFFTQSLLNRSVYDEPFERYLKYFDRSQIHIIDSVNFEKKPQTVLSEVETFLGLPHVFERKDFVFNVQKGFYCLRNVDQKFCSCFGDDRGKKNYGNEVELLKPRLLPLVKMHNERFFNLTGQRFEWL